jgi:hypothetical protein
MAYHVEMFALGYNAGMTCHREGQIAFSYSSDDGSKAQVKELCFHTGSFDDSRMVQGTVEGSVSWRSSDVPSEHNGNEDESEYSCDDSADFSKYTSDGVSEYSRDADSYVHIYSQFKQSCMYVSAIKL